MALTTRTQARLSKKTRAIKTRMVLFMQRLLLWIHLYLSVCPSPPQESAAADDEPFIDQVPTVKADLRTPSGRLPSEQQLMDMFHLGKEQGKRETLSGPLIHQVPTPVAPLCETCLKAGQIIPLWHDSISDYEQYCYCPKCAIAQGKHYPPDTTSRPVAHGELREQLAVRRVLLRHEEESLLHHACFTRFAPLSFGQETAARMEMVKDTDAPFLNESEVTTKRPVVKKAG